MRRSGRSASVRFSSARTTRTLCPRAVGLLALPQANFSAVPLAPKHLPNGANAPETLVRACLRLRRGNAAVVELFHDGPQPVTCDVQPVNLVDDDLRLGLVDLVVDVEAALAFLNVYVVVDPKQRPPTFSPFRAFLSRCSNVRCEVFNRSSSEAKLSEASANERRASRGQGGRAESRINRALQGGSLLRPALLVHLRGERFARACCPLLGEERCGIFIRPSARPRIGGVRGSFWRARPIHC